MIAPVYWRCYYFQVIAGEAAVILIVDDEEMVVNIVRRALAPLGCELLTASSGREAVSICRDRTQPIHLAILDIVMPGMNGRALLDCLRDVFPHIRVLFMSGYLEDEAFEIGGVSSKDGRFVGKPFTAAELREKVQEELAGMSNGFASAG